MQDYASPKRSGHKATYTGPVEKTNVKRPDDIK